MALIIGIWARELISRVIINTLDFDHIKFKMVASIRNIFWLPCGFLGYKMLSKFISLLFLSYLDLKLTKSAVLPFCILGHLEKFKMADGYHTETDYDNNFALELN